MKRLVYSAFCLVLIFVLAACGRPAEVDEASLPTRIPTLSAQDFVVAVAPTATPLPAEPTATAESPAPSEEVTSTEEVTETAEITSTEEGTSAEEVTASDELTESAEITATQELTTSEEVTETDAAPADESLTGTDEITSTDEVTPSEESDVTEAVTETETVTGAAPLIPLPTVTVAAGGAVTETTETSDTEATTTTEEAPAEEAPAEEATDEEAASDDTAAEGVDPTFAGLPEEILAAMATADPERGQQLTLSNACIGCHTPTPNTTMVGPTWYNIATTAEHRIDGMSAGAYLYNSIVHPNDYVVEGYIPGLMLQIYGTLPPQDLADLISYLLTLKEGS
jgi:cytochrome c2